MRIHRSFAPLVFAFALCSANLPSALAQTAARDPDAADRAARDAVNPMRVIIEASKLKVRIKPDGDAAETPAPEKRAARPAPPRAAALAGAPVVAVATPAVKVPGGAKAARAAAAASQAAPSAAPAAPAQTVAKAADAVPAPLMATPSPVVPVLKPVASVPVPLKLAQLVEPALPPSVVRHMHNNVEVVVDFTVNADGSVSGVAVRSSPIKALEPAVVEAVSQWRYQPIGEPRAHAVQLVLHANP